MMDLAAPDRAAPIGHVHTIALGQPPIDAAVRRLDDGTGRPILRRKLRGRRSLVDAPAGVAPPAVVAGEHHTRIVIGQVKRDARATYRQRVRRIQTEEPYAWLPLQRDVGADVELRKGRHPWQGRDVVWTEARYMKRDHPDPRRTVEGVYLQGRWDEGTDHGRLDRPVHEQEAVPLHRQRPGPRRHGPGPMCRAGTQCVATAHPRHCCLSPATSRYYSCSVPRRAHIYLRPDPRGRS